jgi:hypothetical protein
MGEPPVERFFAPDTAVVRFLWLSAFHPGAAIRIVAAPSSCSVAIAKLGRREDPSVDALETDDEKSLPATDCERVFGALDSTGFWRLPTRDSMNRGFDGSDWLIEARRGEETHMVFRWIGREIEAIGRSMIELSGLSSEPIY